LAVLINKRIGNLETRVCTSPELSALQLPAVVQFKLLPSACYFSSLTPARLPLCPMSGKQAALELRQLLGFVFFDFFEQLRLELQDLAKNTGPASVKFGH
jgi:hypothetical protein